jgi:hypothetical protein
MKPNGKSRLKDVSLMIRIVFLAAIVVFSVPRDVSSEEMQIVGNLIKKYLPAYQIYAIDPYTSQNSKLIARSEDGKMIDLGHESDLSSIPTPRTKLVDFIARQNIPVTEGSDAVSIINLINYIRFAPNRARMIRRNTKNGTIYDERIYGLFICDYRYWEHTPTKLEDRWLVSVDYTGPPASIMVPPEYFLEVDDEGNFARFQIKHGL